jgi:PPK2 family polyphosphate:nucleotide phosphotransferase
MSERSQRARTAGSRKHADHVLKAVRVAPGSRPDLERRATDETFGWTKAQAQAEVAEVMAKAAELQTRLYAEGQRSVLFVLQAMDAGGKDGTIRKVFTGLNPAGVKVTSFKVPAGAEAEHDYLWRIHAAVPAKGSIAVFNRSHYEDVLVVRVRKLVRAERWRRRYQHIREFEQMLTDEGTSVLKVYLHISPEEQARRIQDRIDSPDEQWKFRAADLEERKFWPEYRAAYEDAIAETSTDHSPWYVVPADRKWVRNLVVARLLLDTLATIDPRYPRPEKDISGTKVV